MKAVTPIAVAVLAITLVFAGVVAAQQTEQNCAYLSFVPTAQAEVPVPPPEPDEAYQGEAVATDSDSPGCCDVSDCRGESCCDVSDSCSQPCCDLSDGCYSPCWTFTTGALIMSRTSPDDAVLVTDGATTPNEILNASDLDFDWRGGWEVGVIRHNVRCSCWDLEARYFRIDGWRGVWGAVLSPNGAYQEYVTRIGNDQVPAQVCAIYESHLDGFELNLRRPVGCGWLTVLGGVRFVELDERGLTTNYNLGPRLNVATHQVDAINDLYGFQLGADGRLWDGCWLSIDAKARAGVYGNECGNNVRVTQEFGRPYASHATDNQTAFLGELGLTGTVQLVDCLALRAGYQLMWLEGVALAPEQVAVSNPARQLATVDTSGSPLYHGVVISLEYTR